MEGHNSLRARSSSSGGVNTRGPRNVDMPGDPELRISTQKLLDRKVLPAKERLKRLMNEAMSPAKGSGSHGDPGPLGPHEQDPLLSSTGDDDVLDRAADRRPVSQRTDNTRRTAQEERSPTRAARAGDAEEARVRYAAIDENEWYSRSLAIRRLRRLETGIEISVSLHEADRTREV